MLKNLRTSAVASRFVLVLVVVLLMVSTGMLAQTTVATGSIQGVATDPTGAAVVGAKITITQRATGHVVNTVTSSAGTYSSGALSPGVYVVRVESKGFRTVETPITVQVAVTSSGNVKLEVGEESQVIEVQASALQVNTEQATVQGVLTGEQIDKLPVNGRNFLDLAQLEPGVQMQDGQNFDPTKAGYSSISVNGVYGRTPRIEVDGLDVSDETVGTTTQNIAMSSIEEFNISRSSLDLSTDLTSSGAVNVATRSGTNSVHGMAFGNFRDKRAGGANFPGAQDLYLQRDQFGGRFGGAVIRDKMFFFIDSERTQQNNLAPVVTGAPFQALTGGFSSPFRDTVATGKLDWQLSDNVKAFYKFTYNWNKSEGNFGYDYAVYANKDNSPSHAAGLDINQGTWSHSLRFGYLKFHNQIADGSAGLSGALNPLPRVNILFVDNGLQTGPNLLAPQGTIQSNRQLKYDGSKVWGSHILRYGVGYNRIVGGGFAAFIGLAPLTFTGVFAGADPTDPNPLDYPVIGALMGNGQGFFTERQTFGYPSGGQADNRFNWYVGDSWKLKSNFTLSYGVRFVRDTGRQDSDLAPIPCSTIDTSFVTGPLPCAGSTPLLDQWAPGFGKQIRQPNTNFGPQVGFAWDPWKNGKTAIRGGAGIYFENSIFNNVLFDRPAKLNQGLFFADTNLNCNSSVVGGVVVQFPQAGGGSENVSSINGKDLATEVCGQNLSVAGNDVADLQLAYQQAVLAAGPAANPNYIGRTLSFSLPGNGLAAYSPNYRTTRSYQTNIGIQRELWKGGVVTADYVRNVSLHFMLTLDVNHVGDAKYFNQTAAGNAVSATLTACGVGSIDAAIAACPGLSDDPTQPRGATINDFAGFGLDSGLAVFNGQAASTFGRDPDTGAAFPGINPLMGQGEFQFPGGRSVYSGLQTSYKQNVNNPMRGVSGMNLQISYTLSRFTGNGGADQNFNPLAWDFRDPAKYSGPTSLDRLHQFKFGWTFDVAHHGPRISMVGGWSSAPPSTLRLLLPASPVSGQTTAGEIFRTDYTGDGTVGDIFPPLGNPGSFGRSISVGSLAQRINSYNNSVAGTPTQQGQVLIDKGLFTLSQLQALGGVKPLIAAPSTGEVGNADFKGFDFILSWPIKIREGMTLEPSFAAFNAFNFANFGNANLPVLDGRLSNNGGVGDPAPGSAGFVNGTATREQQNLYRTGLGSGVFGVGAPRQLEFGLKFTF